MYNGKSSSSPYQPLPGSLITMFVRQRVAQRLLVAQQHLPSNTRLMVFDAYRPLEVQQALYDQYHERLSSRHPDWAPDRLIAETRKMVSEPSQDPRRPSPHSTGGSVDLVIVYVPEPLLSGLKEIERELPHAQGGELQILELRRLFILNSAITLEFGVPFDSGDPEAELWYYERLRWFHRLTAKQRQGFHSRRLLAYAMRRAGFKAYGPEFWHWNLGNQMAARASWRPWARYGAIELNASQHEHEQWRQEMWADHEQHAGPVPGNETFIVPSPWDDQLGDIARIQPSA